MIAAARRSRRAARPRDVLVGGVLALALAAGVTACAEPSTSGVDAGPTVVEGASTSGAGAGTVPAGRTVRVERVVDGDTLVVDGGERVRLIGIDTPESVKPGAPVECFGKEASRRLAELLPVGTEVVLVADVEPTDRYDRTLAYVYRERDAAFVNATLVEDGFAFAYTVPPNVAHAADFVALQVEARDAGRGLWSACPPP